MTPGNNNPGVDVKRLIRVLDTTAEMASEASLTGALREGAGAATRTYNSTVQYLLERDEIPAFLFPLLPEDATLGDAGISCAQLAEYLRGGLEEPQEKEGEGLQNKQLVIGHLTLSGGSGERGEIEELIREKVAEYLGQNKQDPESSSGETVEQTTVSMSPSGSREARAGARLSLPTGARVEEVREERREGQPTS